MPETTMAQRITRAKRKLAAAKVPYRVPESADPAARLPGVLAVLFLIFNEGYLSSGTGDPVRAELTGEAIRLTRVLRDVLPAEPEVAGLLAVMLLTEARRETRVRNGQLVPLGKQDRAGWDKGLIAEGHRLVRSCLTLIDQLPLDGYHAWHATRADLLRKLGHSTEAKRAYDAAIAATQNSAERAYLSRKSGELT